jgi:hypothetical protein
MAMNDDLIDDADDAWFEKAHLAREAEQEAWRKPQAIAAGRPALKAAGKPLRVMPGGMAATMGPIMSIMQRMNKQ